MQKYAIFFQTLWLGELFLERSPQGKSVTAYYILLKINDIQIAF